MKGYSAEERRAAIRDGERSTAYLPMVRCTPSELAARVRAAKAASLTLSEYIRLKTKP